MFVFVWGGGAHNWRQRHTSSRQQTQGEEVTSQVCFGGGVRESFWGGGGEGEVPVLGEAGRGNGLGRGRAAGGWWRVCGSAPCSTL